jgi:uncharacterized protein YheU (UPF0270 family)
MERKKAMQKAVSLESVSAQNCPKGSKKYMIIDQEQLSQEALDNLVSEYCLRDWGLNETESPLEARKSQVISALNQGRLVIQYSEHEESAHITSAEALNIS